jgi:hypothetical protein
LKRAVSEAANERSGVEILNDGDAELAHGGLAREDKESIPEWKCGGRGYDL